MVGSWRSNGGSKELLVRMFCSAFIPGNTFRWSPRKGLLSILLRKWKAFLNLSIFITFPSLHSNSVIIYLLFIYFYIVPSLEFEVLSSTQFIAEDRSLHGSCLLVFGFSSTSCSLIYMLCTYTGIIWNKLQGIYFN